MNRFAWDLEYDAAFFIPLPRPTGMPADVAAAERWVEESVERLVVMPLAEEASEPWTRTVDASLWRSTASSLVAQVRPEVAHFWFVPPGMYSDVLVAVSLARTTDAIPGAFEEMFEGAAYSTAPVLVPVVSEKRGKGLLIRRAGAFEDPGVPERPVLVAQWTLRLDDGEWVVLIDAIGTALPVFAAFEGQILRLAEGVQTSGVDSAADAPGEVA